MVPNEVKIITKGREIEVIGPKGDLKLHLPPKIEVKIEDNLLLVSRQTDERQSRANHGTIRARLNNMVKGVVFPWEKKLEIRGTGYKAQINGNQLKVWAGYIKPVEMVLPDGITAVVDEDTKITISGADKEVVGQTASNIRKIRKVEPYKGKGIRYLGEFIKLKAGKKAKV
ncbi:MAG TPA: 50S ribosomal protein L6 [Candidatus Woesebacteria bacterium]|nr:50S ribosomal protein L6 [Candidatus Woesebacteria bacterium]